MILTGKRVDAATPARWGLINGVVSTERLIAEARAVAEGIAQLNPVTLDWSKKALDQVPSQIADWPVVLEYGRGVASIIHKQIEKQRTSATP